MSGLIPKYQHWLVLFTFFLPAPFMPLVFPAFFSLMLSYLTYAFSVLLIITVPLILSLRSLRLVSSCLSPDCAFALFHCPFFSHLTLSFLAVI